MRGWTKVLLLGAVLVAGGACGSASRLTEPEAAPSADLLPPPEPGDVLHDGPPPADTTGRWGGGLGSGT